MEDFIAKCGCNCATCPTYKDNLPTNEEKKRCSLGWEKYLNIKLKPEKLRLCDGCSIPDKDRKAYYLNCRVRKCAIFNGLENCAYCSAYPCQDVRTIHSIQEPGARKRIEDRIGYQIPQDDYLALIEPFEGIKHLDEIRKSLKTEDIVDIIPVTKIPRIIPFPNNISLKSDLIGTYQKLHQILSKIATAENVSYARSIEAGKNRKELLKLLWTFGLNGEINNEEKCLILSSDKYSEQKNTSYSSRIQDYILILKKHDLNCELITTDNKRWQTPTGALRREGWYLRLFSSKDISLLEALKNYSKLLEKEHGKNAFKYFSKADMHILG